jgi:hypothetical protein
LLVGGCVGGPEEAKLLVDEASTKIVSLSRSFAVLSYPAAAVDLSSRSLRYAAGLLRRHRRMIGSRWRKLSCARQALLVLAHLRCGDTYARLAAGFGVGVTTVWRYVTELVDLLAAQAPDLAAAVKTATGKAYVALDGTLIAIDRVGMRTKADRPYYSGKHKRHGLNVQLLTDPAGRLIWASPALPGSVHDLKAARRHRLVHALTGYDIPVLGDRGYQGAAGTIRVPIRRRHGRDLPAGTAGTCPPARPPSTPPTPGSGLPANADPPPSRAGACSTACAAAHNGNQGRSRTCCGQSSRSPAVPRARQLRVGDGVYSLLALGRNSGHVNDAVPERGRSRLDDDVPRRQRTAGSAGSRAFDFDDHHLACSKHTAVRRDPKLRPEGHCGVWRQPQLHRTAAWVAGLARCDPHTAGGSVAGEGAEDVLERWSGCLRGKRVRRAWRRRLGGAADEGRRGCGPNRGRGQKRHRARSAEQGGPTGQQRP